MTKTEKFGEKIELPGLRRCSTAKRVMVSGSQSNRASYIDGMVEQAKYMISLRISHAEAASDEIAAAVGRTPDFHWNKGDPKATPKGRLLGGIRERSYCAFDLGRNDDPEVVILETNKSLLASDRFAALEAGRDAEYYITRLIDTNPGFEIRVETILHLASLKIRLAFD